MHFKLDENIAPACRSVLTAAGHSVSTVAEERLSGEADQTLAAICRSLDMCLITLDMDFAQTAAYPPAVQAGLIVLRHPRPTLNGLYGLFRQIAEMLKLESPNRRLWVVEPGRIRIHE